MKILKRIYEWFINHLLIVRIYLITIIISILGLANNYKKN
jgi:hypothetical protein